MNIATLSALVLFALAMSITPGPNNLMLMASGANFGFVRTIPHLLGVCLGFVLMLFLVGLGLGRIFEHWPVLKLILKIAASLYLLWLAWRVANSGKPGEGKTMARPFRFWQAVAFQWVNPKAWAMALGGISLFVPHGQLHVLALTCLVFGAVNIVSISVWASAGVGVRKWLKDDGHLRLFNWFMAALMVGSLLMVLE